jgi:superfamily II DNA or RNA helicase
MYKITLRDIRKTNFSEIYEKLLKENYLIEEEIAHLLKVGVLFLNCENEDVKKLGYRIILFCSNHTDNYVPLYDAAINLGYIPVAKFIENMPRNADKFNNSFFKLFTSSFKENFKQDSLYATSQQLDLSINFKESINNETVAVVAPTSYGKSELIMSSIRKKGNICILVPTKALVAQTKRRILSSNNYNGRKVITHPEMFSIKDKNIIAILTQERLVRLIQKEKELFFDLVFVDEAHNLLEDDERSRLLAIAIIFLQARNENTCFKFLTPFLVNVSNLKIEYTNYNLKEMRISEYLKSERFFYYDFIDEKKLKLYDHFLDKFSIVEKNTHYEDEIDFIIKNKSFKNIIYLNSPKDIENVSMKVARRVDKIDSQRVVKVCKELAQYLHKDYTLINCLKSGVVYHHGSVPDVIKQYIEHIFSEEQEIQFISTTSTLLEGVNIPAEKLFMLDWIKGETRLSASQFKNLIGRVCRFSEVFHPVKGSMKMLEPYIYLVKSDYADGRVNVEKFLKENLRVDKEIVEKSENILLSETELQEGDLKERASVDEFLENLEEGITDKVDIQYAITDFGKACFVHNVHEIKILEVEDRCQAIVDELVSLGQIATDAGEVLYLIDEIFISMLDENKKLKKLERLRADSAQGFYAMFLEWRMSTTSFSEMINSFLWYWKLLVDKNRDTIVYVGKWGDTKRDDKAWSMHWTDIKDKTVSERVNLAIVRIKEEQDFLDNNLLKFIEVLNDVGLIESKLYEKIKYGTSDPEKILLLKNGIGLHLASILLKEYSEFLNLDIINNSVNINSDVLDAMRENGENEILVFEVGYNVSIKK